MFSLEPRFIDEVGDWTIGVALALAAIGAVALQRPSFAVTCIAGAALDILTLRALAHRARAGFEGAGVVGVFLARLVGKAVFVVLAFSIEVLDAAGAVAGVLVVDLTLLTIGPVVAARRAFGKDVGDGGRGGHGD